MEGSLVTAHPELGPLLSEQPQRAKLLDAMVRVVAEKGYETATVADAVRLARVSRGTFYELFESKEACLAAAYRLGLDVLAARVSEAIEQAEDWREELRLGIRAYLRTFDEEPLFARVYLLEWAPVAPSGMPPSAASPGATGASFARGGVAVPGEALYVLAAGVHELTRAHVRAGGRADRTGRRPGGLRRAARHKGGTMDLTFTDAGDRVPRRAAGLAGRQPPRRAARGRRGRLIPVAAGLPAPAGRRRLGGRALAGRVRRAGRDPDPVGDLLRGARAGPGAAARQRPRPAARRPHDHDLGHPGAEGALPGARS